MRYERETVRLLPNYSCWLYASLTDNFPFRYMRNFLLGRLEVNLSLEAPETTERIDKLLAMEEVTCKCGGSTLFPARAQRVHLREARYNYVDDMAKPETIRYEIFHCIHCGLRYTRCE